MTGEKDVTEKKGIENSSSVQYDIVEQKVPTEFHFQYRWILSTFFYLIYTLIEVKICRIIIDTVKDTSVHTVISFIL